MITKEDFQAIVENLGVKGSRANSFIHNHIQDATTARDEKGFSLLTHAIKMNDGGNVATLLINGADIHSPSKTGGVQSNLDYATQYATYGGRKPYAYDAIKTFLDTRQAIGLPFLNGSLRDISSKGKMFEEAKSKGDEEFVSLYHGCKLFSLSENSVQGVMDTYLASNSIKQSSGPTLAVNPVGQYWLTVGFEVQVPRSEVEFPGEKKDNPTIRITEEGNALICNEKQSLEFDKYYTKFLVNPYCLQKEESVMPTYGTVEGDYEAKFSIDEPTLKKLHEVKRIMENNQEKALDRQVIKSPTFIPNNMNESLSSIHKFREMNKPENKQESGLRMKM